MIYNKPIGHAPYDKGIIHGDIFLDIGGIHLVYQPVLCTMREHVKKYGRYGLAKTLKGLSAKLFLQRFLCPNSYDMVNELLSTGKLIEFTAFSENLGTIEGHNTIVWEVRNS